MNRSLIFLPVLLQINNNIRNQFELPVLFYVLVIVLWAIDAAGYSRSASS